MTNGDATQLKNEANELYSKRQYYKAIDIYSQAIELSSEMSVLYSNRALCYINLAQYKTALSDCLKSISIDNNFKAYFRASTCQLHLGNLEDAKNMVVAGRKIKDNEQFRTQSDQLELIDSKLVLYHLKFKHKEYRKALDHIEELFCLLDPSLIGTGLPDSISNLDTSMMFRIPIKWKLWRAECLIGLNDCHEAGQIAMALLRTTEESKNSEAIYIRAKTMYLLDSHPIATVVQFLSTSLSYDPDNKNARLLFKHVKKLEKLKEAGNEYFKAGDWQNAIDTYTEFINNDPEGGAVLAKIYSNRAIVYNRLEQYEKVEEDCNSGLKIIESMGFPNATHSGEDISNKDRQQSLFQKTFSKLYLRRADCFTKQEKFQEAVHEYETCCVLDPENREIKQALNQSKKALEMSKRKNYYKILQVEKSASSIEIKKAYRKLALVYHPDKQANMDEKEKLNAEEMFKDISEAYSVLSDDNKKAMFDAGHNVDGASASAGQHQHNPFGGFGGHDMSDLFAQFGQQQQGGNGFGGGHGGFHFGH